MRMLDKLERGIVAALQVNGRAPWRSVALVLGENERTVARRGNALLEEGAVKVAGLRGGESALIVKASCTVGGGRIAMESLAQRPDSTFAYSVAGPVDVVAEVLANTGRFGSLVGTELEAVPGASRIETIPVMRYFQTIRGWRLGVLGPEQMRALGGTDPDPRVPLKAFPALPHPADEAICAALSRDGRISYERLAREVDASETTVRRRTEWLLEHQVVQLRAIVEPAAVGLPVEALLWLRMPPSQLEEAGLAFARHPRVRYVVALAGRHQLLVDVTLSSMDEFYAFLTLPEWGTAVDDVEVTMVVGSRKRGGQLMDLA